MTVRSPLQKISAEQARMKRQWGYFKADQRRTLEALSARLVILEEFFKRP